MIIKLQQKQLALFSPGIVVADKLRTANALNEILGGLFDSDPVLLPLPDTAPPEFPHTLLKSKDDRHTLKIAKNRLDFFYQNKEEEESLFPVPSVFDNFLKIFGYFKENAHTHFTRSAIVTDWSVELEKSTGAEYLLRKYIREKTPIHNPLDAELHYLNKISIAEFKANQWIRLKSARKISGPEQNKFIIFHVDINTLGEETYEFDKDSLQKFLSESSEVVKNAVDTHLKQLGE